MLKIDVNTWGFYGSGFFYKFPSWEINKNALLHGSF